MFFKTYKYGEQSLKDSIICNEIGKILYMVKEAKGQGFNFKRHAGVAMW